MSKKPFKQEFAIVGLLVIIGAGVAIWGYNFIRGNDLSRPPQFDLSAYNQLQWAKPEEALGKLFGQEETVVASEPVSVKFAQLMAEKIKNEELAPGLYFREFFLGPTPSATKLLIENFLKDFPELQNTAVVDLVEQKCFTVQLIGASQEQVVADLKSKTELIASINPKDLAGFYDVCFVQPQYEKSAADFLTVYPEVKLVIAPHAKDYVAFAAWPGDLQNRDEVIRKISASYETLISIVK